MGFTTDTLFAVGGLLLLIAGAGAFWWLDRRHEQMPSMESGSDVLGVLPVAVMVLRPVRTLDGRLSELRCATANAAAERLFGVRAMDMLGRDIRKSLPWMNAPEHFSTYVAYLDHGMEPSPQVDQQGPAGPVRCQRSVARHGDGLVLVMRDISAESHQNDLQRMRACVQAIGAAARTTAHDLRNPLTNLSLVEDQLRSEPDIVTCAAPYLDMLRRNIDRLRLVADRSVAQPPAITDQAPLFDAELVVHTATVRATERMYGKRIRFTHARQGGGSTLAGSAPAVEEVFFALLCATAELPFTEDHFHLVVHGEEVHVHVTLHNGDRSLAAKERQQLRMRAFAPLPFGEGPGLGSVHAILATHDVLLRFGNKPDEGLWSVAFPRPHAG